MHLKKVMQSHEFPVSNYVNNLKEVFGIYMNELLYAMCMTVILTLAI